jgi:hypothetical protein
MLAGVPRDPRGTRWLTLAFAIGVPLLQTGRVLLWGREWPRPLQWPIAVDAYLAGALLAWGAARGGARLCAAWAFACGMGYRSFFEQVADPARHAGPERLVLAVKGVLLALAVAGAVGAVRAMAGARSPP